MKLLARYLDEQIGRATKLAAKLRMSPSQLSQYKSGHRPIPLDRIKDFVKATDGALVYEDMLTATIKSKAKKRKANAIKRAERLKA